MALLVRLRWAATTWSVSSWALARSFAGFGSVLSDGTWTLGLGSAGMLGRTALAS